MEPVQTSGLNGAAQQHRRTRPRRAKGKRPWRDYEEFRRTVIEPLRQQARAMELEHPSLRGREMASPAANVPAKVSPFKPKRHAYRRRKK